MKVTCSTPHFLFVNSQKAEWTHSNRSHSRGSAPQLAAMRLLLAPLLLIALTDAFSLNASTKLIDGLFDHYNPRASPYVSRLQNAADSGLIVALNLSRAIIANVNERDETISVLINVNYKWRDPRLVWKPSEHDGITVISMRSDAIWVPDVNPCESTYVYNVLKEVIPSVLIHHDGSVSLDVYKMANYIC
ncbi:hypothetical protein PENTCL1PPCAC_21480, partial [Pristionchus entomophagus]